VKRTLVDGIGIALKEIVGNHFFYKVFTFGLGSLVLDRRRRGKCLELGKTCSMLQMQWQMVEL
jgi:hypothetical protein